MASLITGHVAMHGRQFIGYKILEAIVTSSKRSYYTTHN